ISQAVIVLEPGGLRATSRDNGDYAIGRVPSGTYTIRLRRLGYTAPATAITVSEGQTVVRDFIVSRAAVALTEVVIGSRARHTALIHYYGAGEGAGSSGIDMNALPASAIGRIEVLRDGAAAQYGSDAIAGVVNVVLKEGLFAPFLSADLGEYMTSKENPAALP